MRSFEELTHSLYHSYMTTPPLIGIDIGGTKIRLARAESPQHLGSTVDMPTPREFAVAQDLILDQLFKLADRQAIRAVGIASPGPVDTRTGVIGRAHNLHWQHAPIQQWLAHYVSGPIVLAHDAQAGGVCEARYGAGRKHRYVLYVSISTGIGSALILDGTPLPTAHNPEGGRMILPNSHQPTIHYEDRASGRAIVARYGKRAADIKSRHDWNMLAYEIALGLYNLIVACDPEIVILGGGVAVHFKKFIKPLQAHLTSFQPLYPLPPIKQAQYTEHAPLIGALALAETASKT